MHQRKSTVLYKLLVEKTIGTVCIQGCFQNGFEQWNQTFNWTHLPTYWLSDL